MSNCTASDILLAATLSTAYNSTTPFEGSAAALPDYLTKNGVLFSMCWPDPTNCSALALPPSPPGQPPPPPPYASHWSGSWVSQRTGFKPLAGSVVGYVADPLALHLTCLYPTDADTDNRDLDGCGPKKNDPVYGSQGASRMSADAKSAEAKGVRDYLNQRFPGRPFWNISCVEIYGDTSKSGTAWMPNGTVPGLSACEAMRAGRTNDWRHQSTFKQIHK